jgi:hypothetical protein
VEDVVDRLLADPEHERVERRFWAAELGVDASRTMWWQIFDLDELVGELARGEIGYDDFAREAIVHPGFFSSRLDNGWGAGVFHVFLGRPPRRDEMDGLRPLARLFAARKACDGRMVENVYRECLADQAAGLVPEDVPCRRECLLNVNEGAIDPCGCTSDPLLMRFGCSGSGLGEFVDLGTSSCESVSLQRLIDESAGSTDRCPERSEPCPDFVLLIFGGFPASPLPEVSSETRLLLDRLGDALLERGDFWEAAVDRELRRFLGWWQAGIELPNYVLPEVRSVLAAQLRRNASLRDIQRLILTSLLYTAPAAAPPGFASDEAGSELPPWATGPVKMLVGEAWLDSASLAVGESLGVCDYRFVGSDVVHAEKVARYSEREALEESSLLLDGIVDEGELEELSTFAEYRSLAKGLGGCRFDPRARESNLPIVAAQGEIASLLCAFGSEVLPPFADAADTSAAALRNIAEYLGRRILAHNPSPREIDEWTADLRGCLDAGACADGETAGRWLCARLMDSELFAAY